MLKKYERNIKIRKKRQNKISSIIDIFVSWTRGFWRAVLENAKPESNSSIKSLPLSLFTEELEKKNREQKQERRGETT